MVERITITIKKDMLRRIDRMVDGRELRNRSHAIENLISKSLSGGLETALVMAGEGFKNPNPKALTPIGGKPILEHQLDFLKSHGITNIIIASDYSTDKIRQYFGNGRAFGVDIHYIIEDKPMGTAGAVGMVGDYVNGSFVMLNADTLMNPDVYEVYDFHKKHKKLATVLLSTTDNPSSFGVVKMRGNQILKFEEKPQTGAETSRLVNAGFCIFEERVCKIMPDRKMMIEELFNILCRQGQLMGFIHDGPVFDIGTKDGYERARNNYKSFVG